jgi:hypothetical protein
MKKVGPGVAEVGREADFSAVLLTVRLVEMTFVVCGKDGAAKARTKATADP